MVEMAKQRHTTFTTNDSSTEGKKKQGAERKLIGERRIHC
jgi:hypothetical protein